MSVGPCFSKQNVTSLWRRITSVLLLSVGRRLQPGPPLRPRWRRRPLRLGTEPRSLHQHRAVARAVVALRWRHRWGSFPSCFPMYLSYPTCDQCLCFNFQKIDPANIEDFFGLAADVNKSSESGYILFYQAKDATWGVRPAVLFLSTATKVAFHVTHRELLRTKQPARFVRSLPKNEKTPKPHSLCDVPGPAKSRQTALVIGTCAPPSSGMLLLFAISNLASCCHLA